MSISSSLKKLILHRSKQIVQNWELALDDELIAPPTTYKDKILIGTRKGKLLQINQQGKIEWTFSTQEKVDAEESLFLNEEDIYGINDQPVCFSYNKEERILVVTEYGLLYCISSEGKLLWKIKTKGPLRASPAILTEKDQQKIVLGSHDKTIYIITPKGTIEQQIDGKEAIETRPLVLNKSIIVGTSKGSVIALGLDGQIKWQYKTKDKITAPLLNLQSEQQQPQSILVGSQDKRLYCLSIDGELNWTFETKGTILAQPIAFDVNNDNNKEIFLASCDNNMYCLSAYGEMLWSYETGFWITSAPLVADIDDDNEIEVVAGSLDNKAYILAGQGSYTINYIPGLGGIVHQSGHYSGTINKDVGQNKGKLLCQFTAKDQIIGCALLKSNKTVLIATKKGKIFNIKVV